MVHEIIFQDADFPHHFQWCQSTLEGPSLRWVPFGMPRLLPEMHNGVFFLFGRNPNTGAIDGPLGSGVIISLLEGNDRVRQQHFYAVTAAHVVNDGASIIRVNTREGKSRLIDLDPADWASRAGWEDIAIADITDRIATTDQISHLPTNFLASKDFIGQVELGIGEDGFMLGLFLPHTGGERNLVAARFGHISLMANDAAPISQPGTGITSPCHVFDIHSRPGFSGSPVFCYRTPETDMRAVVASRPMKRVRIPNPDSMPLVHYGPSYASYGLRDELEVFDLNSHNNKFLKVLGIHVGQFHDAVEVVKVEKTIAKDSAIHHGDQIRFPGSMTVVVPAWQVLALMAEDETLKQQRKARIEAAEAKLPPSGPVVVSERVKVTGSESDNPSHKEDFTRLLGAAVKGKPPA